MEMYESAMSLSDQNDSELAEGIIHFATECNLLSPETRIHPAYNDLQGDDFRLLKIMQGKAGSDIYCHLKQFQIHTVPSYTALSYTWGSRYGLHEIFVNGFLLLVPTNLWRFLKQARELGGDLSSWFWVDMLSINQRNISEKSVQVSMIHGIFSRARGIVVWLGPSYRGSDAAMRVLARPATYWLDPKRRRQLWASTAGPAVKELCFRAYWYRLWVFQELRVAHQKRLMCGSKTAPWDGYEALMLLSYDYCVPRLDHEVVSVANSPSMRMVQLVTKSVTVDITLWNLIESTAGLRCADVRDKAYALLGVADTGHTGIDPDYTEPVPTLLNKLLHKLHRLASPESLEEAFAQCNHVEDVLGVQRGSIFIMEGQRGAYDAPSEETQYQFQFGEKITLWWAIFYGHTCLQKLIWWEWEYKNLGSRGYVLDAVRMDVSIPVSLLERCQRDTDNRHEFQPSITARRHWSVFDNKSIRCQQDLQLFHLNRCEPEAVLVRNHIARSARTDDEANVTHLLLDYCARSAITVYPFFAHPAEPYALGQAGSLARFCCVETLQLFLKYGLYPVRRADNGIPEILRRAIRRSISSDGLSHLDLAQLRASRERCEVTLETILSDETSETEHGQLGGLAALLIAIMIKFRYLQIGRPSMWAPLTFATSRGQVRTVQLGVSLTEENHLLGTIDENGPVHFPAPSRKPDEAALGFAEKQTVLLHTGEEIIRISNAATSLFQPEFQVQMEQEAHVLARHYEDAYRLVPLRLRNDFRIDVLPVSLSLEPDWETALTDRASTANYLAKW